MDYKSRRPLTAVEPLPLALPKASKAEPLGRLAAAGSLFRRISFCNHPEKKASKAKGERERRKNSREGAKTNTSAREALGWESFSTNTVAESSLGTRPPRQKACVNVPFFPSDSTLYIKFILRHARSREQKDSQKRVHNCPTQNKMLVQCKAPARYG